MPKSKKEQGKKKLEHEEVLEEKDDNASSTVKKEGDSIVSGREKKERKSSDEVDLEKKYSDNSDVLEAGGDCDRVQKRNKTLIAIIILFAGVACGSFFVDIVQLFTQKGFSAKALEDAQVVEYDGNTWVRYDDPKIVVEVFDADDCEECVTDEVLVRLRSLIPTLEAHRINVRTDDGAAYAKENEIKHIPAFLFDDNVIDSDFYQQAAILFKENGNNKQYFEAPSVGVPIGEYLEEPAEDNGIALDDNTENVATIVLYDNPVAKESNVAYPILQKIRSEQKESVHVIVKIVPDSEQKNSVQSALALYCASDQEKYDVYAALFYANHKEVMESEAVKELLYDYAQKAEMDTEKFDICVESGNVKTRLDENKLEASKFGVISAPTFFVNGEPHVGVITYQGLKEKIDAISISDDVE